MDADVAVYAVLTEAEELKELLIKRDLTPWDEARLEQLGDALGECIPAIGYDIRAEEKRKNLMAV